MNTQLRNAIETVFDAVAAARAARHQTFTIGQNRFKVVVEPVREDDALAEVRIRIIRKPL